MPDAPVATVEAEAILHAFVPGLDPAMQLGSTFILEQRAGGDRFGVDDTGLVRTIRSDLSEFATLGTPVPSEVLTSYCDALDVVAASIKEEHRLAQREFRQRFLNTLQPLEERLLRLRLAGGAMHTVFARTIEYLLRINGAMTTVQMHPMIATIHPDLCDDSVDRIIDGKHFGKKWKHAVRTAQQQLKKQGIVRFDGNLWSL